MEVLEFYHAFANSFARNLTLTYNLRHRVRHRSLTTTSEESPLSVLLTTPQLDTSKLILWVAVGPYEITRRIAMGENYEIND